MLAANHPRALDHARHDDLIDAKAVQADSRRHNVHDGVDSPHLVEVHLVHGHAVRFGLCLGKQAEGLLGKRPRAGRKVERREHLPHLCVAAVMMPVRVRRTIAVHARARGTASDALPARRPLGIVQVGHVVVMAVVLLVQRHVKVTAVEPCLLHATNVQLKALACKRSERRAHCLFAGAKVQQRRHCHIAADAGLAVPEKCAHEALPPTARRLICVAR